MSQPLTSRKHALPPALRVIVLVAMVWVFGFFNLFHTHTPAQPIGRTAQTQLAAPSGPSMVAATVEDPCAICLWRSRTPYTPAQLAPAIALTPARLERVALAPRAPPAAAQSRTRNRAPPILA